MNARLRRPIPAIGPLCAGLVSCGHAVPSPDDTVDALIAALEDGDCAAIADVSSASVVGDRATFLETCAQDRPALTAQAAAIRAGRAEPEITATLPLDAVHRVALVYTRDGWRIAAPVPDPRGGATPLEALGALSSLIEGAELRELLDVLSEPMRATITGGFDGLGEALTEIEDGELTIYGETATLTVGSVTIRLALEDGVWRVAAVDRPYTYSYEYDW